MLKLIISVLFVFSSFPAIAGLQCGSYLKDAPNGQVFFSIKEEAPPHSRVYDYIAGAIIPLNEKVQKSLRELPVATPKEPSQSRICVYGTPQDFGRKRLIFVYRFFQVYSESH